MKLVFAKSAQGVEFLPWPMSYIQRSNHRLCFPHKQRLLLFSVFYQVFLLTWLWDAFMHLLRYLVCVSMATPCPEFLASVQTAWLRFWRCYRADLLWDEALAAGELALFPSHSSASAKMLTLHFHFQNLCQYISLWNRENVSMIIKTQP